MGWIDINTDVFTFYPTQSNSFPAKPVTMMNLMDVAIYWPLVEKHVFNCVSWKYTYSRTKHATVI
jgi:hypothetical protein